MICTSFQLYRSMSSMALAWLLAGILLPSGAAARECRFYTDSAGRRRRTCYGLLPGIIAAVIVGLIVILGFASLAWVLRRRRQRARLQTTPIYTQEAPNNLMSQPPSYPPPNYPLAAMHNPPSYPPPEHTTEKPTADADYHPNAPPQVHLPSHPNH